MITALDHIQLAMPPGSDARERAVAYFSGLLGFEDEDKPAPLAHRGGCWFSAGACKVHVGVEEDFSPQKKAHPAFLAEGIGDLAALLEREGFPVEWDRALPDRERFYTEDPFGNRIEIMRNGDGFSQLPERPDG